MSVDADKILQELASYTGKSPDAIRKEARRQLREAQRNRAKARAYRNDPWKFFEELVTPPQFRPDLTSHHRDVIAFLSGPSGRDKLLLTPRGTQKSSIKHGELARRALPNLDDQGRPLPGHNPNIRIMLDHQLHENSKKHLASIKGIFQSESIRAVYGDLIPTVNERMLKNNEAQLTLRTREDLTLQDPTFKASAIDVDETGAHYDLIVGDDLVTKDNSGENCTAESLQRPIDRFKAYIDLLVAGGEVWLIGTRWHLMDLYGWVIETLIDKRCQYEKEGMVFIRDQHADGCMCDFEVFHRGLRKPDGSYWIPNQWNDARVERLIRTTSRYHYFSNYENNPVDPDNVWFRHENIKRAVASWPEPEAFDELKIKLLWCIVVDPAESKRRGASPTGITVTGVDLETGHWYVHYAMQEKLDTAELIRTVLRLWRTYREFGPNVRFGMEQNTRKALAYSIDMAQKQEKLYFPIRPLMPDTHGGPQAKVRHIKGKLSAVLDFGRISINPELRILRAVLLTLPAGDPDVADALAYTADMAPPPPGAGDREDNKARRVEPEPELFPGTGM